MLPTQRLVVLRDGSFRVLGDGEAMPEGAQAASAVSLGTSATPRTGTVVQNTTTTQRQTFTTLEEWQRNWDRCRALAPAQWTDYLQKRRFMQDNPNCLGVMSRVPEAPGYCPEPLATTTSEEYARQYPQCSAIAETIQRRESEALSARSCAQRAAADGVSRETSTPAQIEAWRRANPGCEPPQRLVGEKSGVFCEEVAKTNRIYQDSTPEQKAWFLSGPGMGFCTPQALPERPAIEWLEDAPRWFLPTVGILGVFAASAVFWERVTRRG